MRGPCLLAVAVGFATAVVASAADAPVATVGGHAISRADLEAHVKTKLAEIETQRYEALREGLDELIADELVAQEAKAHGTTPEALLKQEVASKVAAPTDAEMQKLYDDNKQQLGGQTLEQVKPRLVEYLKQQKEEERREAFIGELKGKYKTTIALKAPTIDVATAGRPEKGGGAKAPVTIVTFSDYECPYCKRAEDVVERVMKAYGDKVRLVFRDYPLPFHSHARPAAEAANCANAQGKFWEYHAKLFASQPALGAEQLRAYAKEVGLDEAKFAECLSKTSFKATIDKDIADGSSVGVNGTPAFFIGPTPHKGDTVSGRSLSGAQPFEKFKELIDEELAAAKAS